MTRVGIVMPLGELRGGVERMLVNLLRAHARRDGPPHVRYAVAFLEDGPLVETVRALGAEAVVVPAGRLRQPARVARTVAALARWLRSTRADAVLSWAAKGHLYAGPAALRVGVPAAWYVHSLPDGAWMDRLVTAVPARLVLCCGRSAEAAQRRMWPRRPTQTAYIAVDLDEFDPDRLPPAPAARRALGLDPDGPLVVMVARLQRWKGVHVFVEAAARLRAPHPAARFVVVGGPHWAEPDYPGELERQAEALGVADRIRWAGLQDNVPLWMQAADVVVHASFDEPTGTVIVEAMALGKPVVVARSAGPMEFVEDGANGLLATPGDAAELAAQIGRVLASPPLGARLGAAACLRARRFSTVRLADTLAETFAGLAGGPAAPRRPRAPAGPPAH